MNRITAINEESEIDDEDENQVTKEAEETIAVSEYTRALNIKKNGNTDIALNLLKELLEAKVVYEITKEQKKKTLFSVKYNCFKNVGFIYEENGDKENALKNLIEAVELDDTDVYTMNRLGQLALDMKQLDIAHMAFEKCLKRNPNHWPSGDGILQILCQREDYNEAYGWALMWYDKNSDYEHGLDVILEIREKFDGGGLEYIENCWSNKFKDKSIKRSNPNSMFPGCSFIEPKIEPKPNIDQFQFSDEKELNWSSIGNLIINMYEHFENTGKQTAIGYTFDFVDLFKQQEKEQVPNNIQVIEEPVADTKALENGDEEMHVADMPESMPKDENSISNPDNTKFAVPISNDTQASAGTPTEVIAEDENESKDEVSSRPKQGRRRGSDLQFLEQWCYWDRNRKSSQRRKNQQSERNESEATINGILKKILAKYFEETFDNESPFVPEKQLKIEEKEQVQSNKNELVKEEVNLDRFQENTKAFFDDLIGEMKASPFCLIILVFKWSQFISRFWEQPIPKEIQEQYLKIYSFYLNHYDMCGWASLDLKDYQAAFRMTSLYLELFHDRAFCTAKPNFKNEINENWFKLYNYLVFQSGFYEQSDDEVEASKYQKRLYWLQYCLALYENDLCRSVNCLLAIKELLSVHNDEYKLEFPNQSNNNYIDLPTVDALITSQERTISLNSVQQLYADKKWEELIVILQASLINLDNYKTADCIAMRITTQIEVLLECFWSLESFDECLVWSERCLKYAVDFFTDAPKDSYRQDEWGKCVSFILTYIESLIINESYIIVSSLGKYYSRLIQTMVRIVSHQLDSHFEKNSNQLHPIDIKMPWVILHHILQREEDLTPKAKRKLSTDSVVTDGSAEEIEETIPNSIMIFFTAHEYLGVRSWCTKDAGKLLSYTLSVVVPRLRTPYLEPFRDIIAEYLEQITYCLYGYPAKKARVKHIEEHDAQNVDLTWEHATQLFDLYRPDQLPEFNSYKNDSITSEMEQLLQRIIALIPSEIDPSTKDNEIEKFIGGQLTELPKGLDILPYRVQPLFYLLADYYFKNRDFAKSVKYYVLDLNNYPIRFDSWAGLALSKASLLETKLNSCTITYSVDEMIQDSEELLRCFEQCLKLDDQIVLLWIEYGNYAYALHSFCSRSLKQSSDTLSMERFSFMEEKKEQCLKIAYDCFTTVDKSTNSNQPNDTEKGDDDDSHDEKWLYHYMLGKIAEKRKEQPNVILEHYLKSAKFLYEHNATYPFKISFTNPQNLALEALEIFYRITAAIIKYVEQHSVITRAVGKYFLKVLKGLSNSPFALSQAKINENSINAFKRKISMANEEASKQKKAKIDEIAPVATNQHEVLVETVTVPTPEIISSTETPEGNVSSENKTSETTECKISNDVAITEPQPEALTELLTEAPTEAFEAPAAAVAEAPAAALAEPLAAALAEAPAAAVAETPAAVLAEPPAAALAATPAAALSVDPSIEKLSIEKDAVPISHPIVASVITAPTKTPNETPKEKPNIEEDSVPISHPIVANVIAEDQLNSPLRRGSQESTATTTTQTTTTGTDSTSSSSSDSSSTETSSSETDDSSSEDDANKDPNAPLSESDVEMIYKMCMKNFEECITRFPEHFKSIYRLVLIYMNAPERIKDLKKCKQLLLGTYTTALGNQIQGLFSDRKNNNLFNGIWRNPSSEIDRPGSFSSQLSKCVSILLQILRKNCDYKMFLEIIIHLQKTPDADKRYIKELERNELCQLAISFCSWSFKDLLKQCSADKRDDNEILSLLLEIYKAHKKCLKQTSQKESIFSPLMVDAYKVYIQGKVERLPENISVLDLAIKLCLQEINLKKNQEKQGIQMAPNVQRFLPGIPYSHTTMAAKAALTTATPQVPKTPGSLSLLGPQNVTITTPIASTTPNFTTPISTSSYTTGPSRPRGRPPGSKNSPITSPMANLSPFGRMDTPTLNSIMQLYSNPALMQTLTQFTDPSSLNAFLTEYFKLMSASGNMAHIMPTSSLSSKSSQPPLKTSQSHSSPNLTIQQTKTSKNDIHSPFSLPSASTVIQKSISSTKIVSSNNSSSIASGITPQKYTTSSNIVSSSNSSSVTPVTAHKNVSSSNIVSSSISSSAANIMKTGSSTVITVGSGELTITPTITITPKVPASSTPTSSITPTVSKRPRTSNSPAFTLTSKVVDLTGLSPAKSKPPTNLPSDLPKSLSIIPTSSTYTAKPMVLSKQVVTVQSENLMKPNKPKKRQTANVAPQAKKNFSKQMTPPLSMTPKQNPMPFGGLGIGNLSPKEFNKQLAILNQYKELLRSTNSSSSKSFLSQFEKFVTTPPSQNVPSNTKPKVSKPSASATTTSGSSQRGMISVKTLDSLQNPKTSNMKQTFAKPEMASHSGKGINPYGTINQNIAHSPQKVVYPTATSFGAMRACNTTPPAPGLQISPTKSLQQKLAERKIVFNDLGQQAVSTSRPSSASSTGSSKTRKSDNDVIILD